MDRIEIRTTAVSFAARLSVGHYQVRFLTETRSFIVMLVELEKKDIITLLKGNTPPYHIINKIPADIGHFVGGFVEKFDWTITESDCQYSEEYLYNLYLMCKNE